MLKLYYATDSELYQRLFDSFKQSYAHVKMKNVQKLVTDVWRSYKDLARTEEELEVIVNKRIEKELQRAANKKPSAFRYIYPTEEGAGCSEKPGEIRINPKTGIPIDVLGADTRLTAKSLAKFNAAQEPSSEDSDAETHADTLLSTYSVLSLRPKDETPEEKKERKRLFKEYRKERRVEKKANRDAFKEEKMRQKKIMLNNTSNVQGNRILL